MRPIPLEKIERIIELTEKGMSRPAIARELGISKFSVWKYQKKFLLL